MENLKKTELSKHLVMARASIRKRSHKILHAKGDYNNKVFNIMLHQSYMRPHEHPGTEKIEHIQLLKGKLGIIFFDRYGAMEKTKILSDGALNPKIIVPAYTFHTYVILSEIAVTYETMDGVYDADNWKNSLGWAPLEGSDLAKNYLSNLRSYFPSKDV